MGYRVLLAFAVAPLTAAAVLWALISISVGVPNVGFMISVLLVAYGAVVVLGVPAFLMTASMNLHAPYGHSLVGALIGLVPAGFFALLAARWQFTLGTILASSVAGLAFGLIAGRNLTIVGGVRDAR